MISLSNNSVHTKISQITKLIPSLPDGFCGLGGIQLPNGDFLLCGENTESSETDECLLFKDGSN